MSDPLGIIAGNGEFPFLLGHAARQQGIHTVAAAFEGETNPDIAQSVDEVEWVRLGQLDRLIHVFTKRQVTRAVMAGGVSPANLYKNLSLDLRMIALAARLKERNAQTIFGAIAAECAKDGVMLLDPRPFFGDAVPHADNLTRRSPSREQHEDVIFGLKIAKAVAGLDIGQTVVVKDGTVLAVEGFEGSDECIRRGGRLAGEKGGAVVIKVAKPNHDFRFDIPCVGIHTIESCTVGNVAVLAVEAGATLLLGRDKVLASAEKQGIRVVAVEAR
jgi:UDP-2,3-diacylglucosamine hydrolase